MPPKPLGDVAMSPAERQQRRRDKLTALRDAAERHCAMTVVAAPPNPADYPRMLYHGDGRIQVVQDPEEHDRLRAEGWDMIPQKHERPVSAYGVLGVSSDPMVETIRQVIRDEVRAVLREELNQHDLSVAD